MIKKYFNAKCLLAIFLTFVFSFAGSLFAQLPTGYVSLPSSSTLTTNGNFTVQGVAVPTSGVVKPNLPSNTNATVNSTTSVTSQARYLGSNSYMDDAATGANYNTYSLMTGNKTAGWPFTGALLNTFPGDAANNVAATDSYLYSNGNVWPDTEYLIWSQTISGLVPNRWYTFYMYVNQYCPK